MPFLKPRKQTVSNANVIPFLPQSRLDVTDITPVVAGAPVVVTLPVGKNTIERLVIEHNLPVGSTTELKLLINDNTVWDLNSFDEYRRLAAYWGETQEPLITETLENGELNGTNIEVIDFERQFLSSLNQKKAFGLGTSNIQKLALSFKIAANVVNPVVNASVVLGSPSNLGMIRIIRRIDFTANVVGQRTINRPFLENPNNQARVLAAHFLSSSVTACEVRKGATIVDQNISGRMNDLRQRKAGRTPDAYWFTLDWLLQNDVTGAFVIESDPQRQTVLMPTLAAAGRAEILCEYWGTLGSA